MAVRTEDRAAVTTRIRSGTLNREHHRWHSPSLAREMEMLVFGHSGARVLVFPTSMGRFFEWEDRGMVGALAGSIEVGGLQLFCVDSVDQESWYAEGKHPADCAVRHEQYEHYLLSEVLPFSEQRNSNPFLIVTGASFGAYHAMNLALRHPHRVGRVLAMAGLYDIKRMTGGYDDARVYANDPSHYMLNSLPADHLEAIRNIDIIMSIGRDDPNRADNEHLSGALSRQDIWHAFRLWDGWAHDWPWWRDMVTLYIGGHD